MKKLFAVSILAILLSLVFSPELIRQSSPKFSFVGEAEAIVGAPATPASVAGVARRTTRRAVAVTGAAAIAYQATPPPQVVVVNPPPSAAVPASAVPIGTVTPVLPRDCSTITVNGVNYSNCNGVFYKAAFQGNDLVYVVVEKPFK